MILSGNMCMTGYTDRDYIKSVLFRIPSMVMVVCGRNSTFYARQCFGIRKFFINASIMDRISSQYFIMLRRTLMIGFSKFSFILNTFRSFLICAYIYFIRLCRSNSFCTSNTSSLKFQRNDICFSRIGISFPIFFYRFPVFAITAPFKLFHNKYHSIIVSYNVK